jgi:hypothetical protein
MVVAKRLPTSEQLPVGMDLAVTEDVHGQHPEV